MPSPDADLSPDERRQEVAAVLAALPASGLWNDARHGDLGAVAGGAVVAAIRRQRVDAHLLCAGRHR